MRKTRKSVSTKKEISQCKTAKEKQEDFIMLPTVDYSGSVVKTKI